MNQSAITFIINGTTYRLSAGDSSAIRNIPETDRVELVALLEAVQVQDGLSKKAIDAATARVATPIDRVQGTLAGESGGQQVPKTERLGTGDVDALMARLVVEEKRNQKPGLTKRGVYKAVGIFAALVFLVVIII